MATYPLKNIAILGGDTYQIQGGEFYVIEVETQNTSADAFATFPSKSHIINDSTVTVYDKDGNVQSGFDFTKLLSTPCMAHIITHGSGGNINSYAGLIGVDDIQAPTYFSISFESDWKSPLSVPTRYGVIIEILQGSIQAVDGYALQVSGGGGSSSVTTYYLFNEWGSAATFASMATAQTCVLKDSNINDVSISTLATAFDAGTVYIQDADGAKTRVLSLGYDSGSVKYFYTLMPSSTASAKLRSCDWSNNKYYMLNVNL